MLTSLEFRYLFALAFKLFMAGCIRVVLTMLVHLWWRLHPFAAFIHFNKNTNLNRDAEASRPRKIKRNPDFAMMTNVNGNNVDLVRIPQSSPIVSAGVVQHVRFHRHSVSLRRCILKIIALDNRRDAVVSDDHKSQGAANITDDHMTI